jgi:hypothetical protein
MIWGNVISAPNRWMAWWLRRRGWVCFYLDAGARQCGPDPAPPGQMSGCWLALYEAGQRRGPQ